MYVLLMKWDALVFNALVDHDVNVILVGDEWDEKWIPPSAYQQCYRYLKLNNFNSIEMLSSLYHDLLALEVSVDHVLWNNELAVSAGGFLRECFSIDGMKSHFVLSARDKRAMRHALKEKAYSVEFASIPCLFGHSIESLDASFLNRAPYVLKPSSAAGSLLTRIVEPDEDKECLLLDAWEQGDWGPYRSKSMIAESIIHGDEYHADGCITHGELKLVSVSKYFDKHVHSDNRRGQDGSFVLPRVAHELFYQNAEQLVGDALASMGYNNTTFHLEFIYDGSQFHFLESAARVGGSGALIKSIEFATGINISRYFVSELLNKPYHEAVPRGDYVGFTNVVPSHKGVVKSLPDYNVIGERVGLLWHQCHFKVDDHVDPSLGQYRWGNQIVFGRDSEQALLESFWHLHRNAQVQLV
ncbi:ATP-grasp domain-containing protein [Vibrio lentus]|uniref:ATP-grasp domain-containing protein n=1 Tax=Vibrio lentus TaxID=136468 RepID=A0A2N7BJ46_9VIBR|nr:ATP-grasp domain-containing protein [Vibrio lentus]PME48231.1 hypothetical protein BCV34_15935 [Vibrio lentus]PME56560.1 hypothetical protein BCV30_19125 [Vibrio lentus]PME92351.1 hypothetical protein BCV27_21960 [Vibrio lentus]PMI12048.1 hypothetical protein BCU53_21880 [Vibrio lentus]PMK88832.1 hypothetical protein BCT90_06110 [Vibrio lentus]